MIRELAHQKKNAEGGGGDGVAWRAADARTPLGKRRLGGRWKQLRGDGGSAL